MRKIRKTTVPLIAVLVMMFIFTSAPTLAGNILLSNNTGTDNAVFFIEDEASLVMNGFDLSPLGVQLPIALDAVTISVNTPVLGRSIDLVIYQDGNGGSPIDATLVHRQQVSLDQRGNNRILLSEAAIITEPVVWVGFYLPVDFRFNADKSGASVLTYWAWSTGGTFDLNSLASAEVLGPSDGSAPVGIDMQGIARISAELRPPINEEVITNAPIGQQVVAEENQDTSILEYYPYCGTLLYDPQDILISSGFSFTTKCDVADEYNAPTGVVQPGGEILDMQRAGHLYKIEAYIAESQRVEGNSHQLPIPVTHCMGILPGDLEQAVIAETRGIPEVWHILPTMRFGTLVCAEVTNAGYLSYFLPRTESSPPNVNLAIGWAIVSPHPLQCGKDTSISVPIVNTGQDWFWTPTGDIKIIIEDVHVRTGVVIGAIEHKIETSRLGPGMRVVIEKGQLYVDTYVGELHRLQVRVDFDDQILETNEFDNTWFTDYILGFPTGKKKCATKPTS
jgi:hypothetical protein